MSTDSESLDNLRAEIDSIDDSLHDLIMRRAEVVGRVKEAKQSSSGGIFRPGREAEVLRRLAKRHRGELPESVIMRIWRELISAFVVMQGEFKVAVWDNGRSTFWDIARDHFGSSAPLIGHVTTNAVVQAVTDGSATAGILPLPQNNEVEPWWPSLKNNNAGNEVRVCARLPFTSGSNGPVGRSEALLVAGITPVETDSDRSFLMIECTRPVTASHLTELISSSGLEPFDLVILKKTVAENSSALFFVEVNGFVSMEDTRVEQFLRDNPYFSMAHVVGGYAVPLTFGG